MDKGTQTSMLMLLALVMGLLAAVPAMAATVSLEGVVTAGNDPGCVMVRDHQGNSFVLEGTGWYGLIGNDYVRLDGTIGYVGPASGWSGPVPQPVDTVAPGYVDIHCHAGQHIGIIAAEVFLIDEEVNHVADRERGGFLQVRAEPHADVVGGRLRTRPEQVLVLVDHEAEGPGKEGLHGGDVDFAVALAGVAISNFEERSLGMDRDIECGSRDQLFVIHVTGVHPGRRAVDTAGRGRRSEAHTAEEGMKRNIDGWGEMSHHPGAIQRNNFGSAVRIIVGQKAATRSKAVAGPRRVDIDLEDLNLEHVTGLG